MHPNVKDITGQRFGRLVVIERAGTAVNRSVKWLCLCDCGTERAIASPHLVHGRTLSCGCYRRERKAMLLTGKPAPNRKPVEEVAVKHLVREYRRGASARGLVWQLDPFLCRVLFQSACFYCGAPPARALRTSHGWADFLYNGLDRLDNAEGYTAQNVVPACFQCNVAKGTASVGEFLGWAQRLFENLGKCKHMAATELFLGERPEPSEEPAPVPPCEEPMPAALQEWSARVLKERELWD